MRTATTDTTGSTVWKPARSYHERASRWLEPYDGKLSRTVPRGGRCSNALLLPDPSRRTLYFLTGKEATEEFAGVVQPGLVFVLSGAWRVFAVKGRRRPVPATSLYFAPYWNVNPEGTICAGNTETPQHRTPQEIPAWSRAFFSSRFTHPNFGGRRQVAVPGGVLALWRETAARGRFPGRALLSAQCTLGDLIVLAMGGKPCTGT